MPNALPLLRIVFCGAVVACGPSIPAEYQPQAGDVVLQSLPHGPLVDTIEGATGSPFSHCGFVVWRNDEWQVLEALHTVHFTPLAQWIDRGRNDKFVSFRWHEQVAGRVPEILCHAERWLGHPYDQRYRWDDQAIYCSELIYKAVEQATGRQLAPLVPLKDLHWRPYKEVIESIEGGAVPLDREMITPVALTTSPYLTQVYPLVSAGSE